MKVFDGSFDEYKERLTAEFEQKALIKRRKEGKA